MTSIRREALALPHASGGYRGEVVVIEVNDGKERFAARHVCSEVRDNEQQALLDAQSRLLRLAPARTLGA